MTTLKKQKLTETKFNVSKLGVKVVTREKGAEETVTVEDLESAGRISLFDASNPTSTPSTNAPYILFFDGKKETVLGLAHRSSASWPIDESTALLPLSDTVFRISQDCLNSCILGVKHWLSCRPGLGFTRGLRWFFFYHLNDAMDLKRFMDWQLIMQVSPPVELNCVGRKFVFTCFPTHTSYAKWMLSQPPHQRSYFEIPDDWEPFRVFADVEFLLPLNEHDDRKEDAFCKQLSSVMAAHIQTLLKITDKGARDKFASSILILKSSRVDSSKSKLWKASYHILFPITLKHHQMKLLMTAVVGMIKNTPNSECFVKHCQHQQPPPPPRQQQQQQQQQPPPPPQQQQPPPPHQQQQQYVPVDLAPYAAKHSLRCYLSYKQPSITAKPDPLTTVPFSFIVEEDDKQFHDEVSRVSKTCLIPDRDRVDLRSRFYTDFSLLFDQDDVLIHTKQDPTTQLKARQSFATSETNIKIQQLRREEPLSSSSSSVPLSADEETVLLSVFPGLASRHVDLLKQLQLALKHQLKMYGDDSSQVKLTCIQPKKWVLTNTPNKPRRCLSVVINNSSSSSSTFHQHQHAFLTFLKPHSQRANKIHVYIKCFQTSENCPSVKLCEINLIYLHPLVKVGLM